MVGNSNYSGIHYIITVVHGNSNYSGTHYIITCTCTVQYCRVLTGIIACEELMSTNWAEAESGDCIDSLTACTRLDICSATCLQWLDNWVWLASFLIIIIIIENLTTNNNNNASFHTH